VPDPPLIWREGGSRLLDYGDGGQRDDGPAVLFVPSLVNRAHVLDLLPERSMLRWLAARGTRPLLLDWGWPGELERGFSLTDYIAGRLERALAAVPGRVVLAGYCMGGLLALAAALRRPDRVGGLVLLATPWDFHAAGDGMGPAAAAALPVLEPALAATGTLPVDALQSLFALADEAGVAQRYRAFATLDPACARARVFVALEDWLNDGVPLAAPVARETLRDWYGANTPARERWLVAGQAVRPGALACPVFVALPTRDRVVPRASARALADALPRAVTWEVAAGHVGMIAGGGAEAALWPALLAWLRAG
jgi:poly(3-hydroxyalkanoate) synthetase